jgi:hypothetical protein
MASRRFWLNRIIVRKAIFEHIQVVLSLIRLEEEANVPFSKGADMPAGDPF